MTTLVRTMSGSVYQIDYGTSEIRRLGGPAGPTPYQGPEGGWRKYDDLDGPVIGMPMTITWHRPALPGGTDIHGHVLPGTVTSPVTEIHRNVPVMLPEAVAEGWVD